MTDICMLQNCDEPIDRIIDGRGFCPQHRTLSEDPPPQRRIAGYD